MTFIYCISLPLFGCFLIHKFTRRKNAVALLRKLFESYVSGQNQFKAALPSAARVFQRFEAHLLWLCWGNCLKVVLQEPGLRCFCRTKSDKDRTSCCRLCDIYFCVFCGQTVCLFVSALTEKTILCRNVSVDLKTTSADDGHKRRCRQQRQLCHRRRRCEGKDFFVVLCDFIFFPFKIDFARCWVSFERVALAEFSFPALPSGLQRHIFFVFRFFCFCVDIFLMKFAVRVSESQVCLKSLFNLCLCCVWGFYSFWGFIAISVFLSPKMIEIAIKPQTNKHPNGNKDSNWTLILDNFGIQRVGL